MVVQPGNFSRLEKKTRQRQLRQTWMWSGLTIVLLVVLVWAGVPGFIKLAGWWGDVNSATIESGDTDTLAPAPPHLTLPTDATNSSSLQLTGSSEPGANVEVFVNQQSVKTVTADADGQFLASDLTLVEGSNEIFAKARDEAGNESTNSRTETLTYDAKEPVLTIESPSEGAVFYGSSQKKLEVKGQTEPEAEVEINQRSVIVNQDGTFALTIQLADGEQFIQIKARDEAGNETVEEINVTYTP